MLGRCVAYSFIQEARLASARRSGLHVAQANSLKLILTQSILRNAAIPNYLMPMSFQRVIRGFHCRRSPVRLLFFTVLKYLKRTYGILQVRRSRCARSISAAYRALVHPQHD